MGSAGRSPAQEQEQLQPAFHCLPDTEDMLLLLDADAGPKDFKSAQSEVVQFELWLWVQQRHTQELLAAAERRKREQQDPQPSEQMQEPSEQMQETAQQQPHQS